MKTLFALFALLLPASGQSLMNMRLPPMSGTPGNYSSTTNFAVGSNTTARILNFLGTAEVTGGTLSVLYPGTPAYPIPIATPDILNVPILGPCTNTITVTASGAGATATFLLQYETVNTAVNPGGTMIQPPGFSTSIALQTSTNLTTWTTLTNASFGKTNRARFFRMSQAIP